MVPITSIRFSDSIVRIVPWVPEVFSPSESWGRHCGGGSSPAPRHQQFRSQLSESEKTSGTQGIRTHRPLQNNLKGLLRESADHFIAAACEQQRNVMSRTSWQLQLEAMPNSLLMRTTPRKHASFAVRSPQF